MKEQEFIFEYRVAICGEQVVERRTAVRARDAHEAKRKLKEFIEKKLSFTILKTEQKKLNEQSR